MSHGFSLTNQRVVLLAPHPDDDILVAGGLLQKLANAMCQIVVIYITNGDNNPWPQRVLERRWHIHDSDRKRWGARRRTEALAALGRLGISLQTVFMGFPDQGLTGWLMDGSKRRTAVSHLVSKLAIYQPTLIIAPGLFDMHPDHSATLLMLRDALAELEAPQGRPGPRVFYYSVHPDRPLPGARISFALSEAERQKKAEALQGHASQMVLSRRRFLRYARAEEIFYEAEQIEMPGHLLQAAYVLQDEVRLVLKKPSWLDRLLGVSVQVLPASGYGQGVIFDLPLLRLGRVALRTTGQAPSHQQVTLSRVGSCWVAGLPRALFNDESVLYAKTNLATVFLDRAGWQRLPVFDAVKEAVTRQAARTVAIIPCYNVAPWCRDTLLKAVACVDQVIVVDDGSHDGTADVVRRIRDNGAANLHLIEKPVNEGKGSALIDGMRFALEHFEFQELVTLDGDGQHRPEDIEKGLEVFGRHGDFVIGTRNFAGMPARSLLGNTLTLRLMRLFYSNCPHDTQSGFRIFSRRFVQQIVGRVGKGRYETELQTLLLALHCAIPIGEFSIETIYLDGNKSSHFRPLIDSARIIQALLRWRSPI